MDSFVIRTYGRTELAQIYCPNPVSYTHLTLPTIA